MLCCGIIAGLGRLTGSGFNCPPRSLPACHCRPEPPAPGNTPRRSWRGTDSGAAACPRCVGSVPRLGRSVKKWRISFWTTGGTNIWRQQKLGTREDKTVRPRGAMRGPPNFTGGHQSIPTGPTLLAPLCFYAINTFQINDNRTKQMKIISIR